MLLSPSPGHHRSHVSYSNSTISRSPSCISLRSAHRNVLNSFTLGAGGGVGGGGVGGGVGGGDGGGVIGGGGDGVGGGGGMKEQVELTPA